MAVGVCVRTGCHIVNDKCLPTVGSRDCAQSSFIKRHPPPEQNITLHNGIISTLCQSMTVSSTLLSALMGPLYRRCSSFNVSSVIMISGSTHIILFYWDTNNLCSYPTSIPCIILSHSVKRRIVIINMVDYYCVTGVISLLQIVSSIDFTYSKLLSPEQHRIIFF